LQKRAEPETGRREARELLRRCNTRAAFCAAPVRDAQAELANVQQFVSDRSQAMIGIMSPEEIESMLRSAQVGRIGCSSNDHPYVVPINYAYDGEFVYGFSTLGRKVTVMREQPSVCFDVDEIAESSTWRCVIVEGQYEELTGESCRQAAMQRLARDSGATVPRSLDASRNIVVFRIRVTEKSGRFERRDA
jgi:nitroimidazol reductase NimA-like FMN-containing flavoprotein (pyridoxamine 5'-phosphate oxidase superfamily)